MKPSLIGLLPLAAAGLCARAGTDVHRLDVSTQPPLSPEAPYVSHWRGTNPSGTTLSANRFSLLRDGQVMPATVGEIHPQRYPVEWWEEAILEMKAGGLNTIGAYWFWTFIEPRPGRFDFAGRNDIWAFLDLCRKHDMLVFARIGPFCNAEILCGGLPPWIFGMPLVERIFDQESGLPVADQLDAPDRVWHVGLKRFARVLGGPGLVFYATRDDRNTRQMMSDEGMLLDQKTVSKQDSRLKAITFHPEYRAEFIAR